MSVRWEWDTANNREALGGNTDPQSIAPTKNTDGSIDWMSTARHAAQTAENYMSANLRFRWSRSYAAFQSKHFEASKYNAKRYRGRSSLFRPKTRMAIRKAGAAVGAAFFSTHDVVQMQAEDDSNELQRAGAKLQHELLNLRLDRANTDYGIPWFLIVVGAHQDAMIAGICASKQEWKYSAEIIGYETVEYTDPDTGELFEEEQAITRQTSSKPEITLFPPEMCLRDPSANWIDQAQQSSFVILKYPMSVGDVRARMKIGNPIGEPWNDVEEADLRRSVVDQDNAGVRRSREGKGLDRYDDSYTTVRDHETVWVHENFIRYQGQDNQFWSLGVHTQLTEPIPTRDAYPEQKGRRPIVIGYGQIEAHKTDPQSTVESLQPLQMEANDIVNLRLDNVKQNMSPITKIRRGKNVDISQVQNRSADSVIWMNNLDDIEWDRPADVTQSAYAEMDRINVDMDDLAGTFSSSSVQSNRQMNETVGGMNLMNASANSMGEFDLRVFNETWMEPVLRQFANLNAYYENDENILSIAGSKAGLWDQYIEGMTDLDGLLMQNVQLRVDAGMGASDPMQRIQKFRMGAETVAVMLGEQSQQLIKPQEVIEEVFGMLGYKDGARFYKVGEEEEGPDPQLMMAMQQMEQMGQEIQRLTRELEDGEADRENAVLLEQIKSATALIKESMQNKRDAANTQLQQSSQILTHHANVAATKQRGEAASEANKAKAQQAKAKPKTKALV